MPLPFLPLPSFSFLVACTLFLLLLHAFPPLVMLTGTVLHVPDSVIEP